MRTLLFVPGDRPDRIVKALAIDADAIAIDLEDAVVDDAKEGARDLVVDALTAVRAPVATEVFVRINALDTRWAEKDLSALISIAGRGGHLAGVIVPKIQSPADVRRVDRTLSAAPGTAGLVLLPIVETARAVLNSPAIAAAAARVRTLLFGTLDLAGELRVTPTVEGRELLHARSQVVLATAAAGLPGPLDGPYPALNDTDGLTRSSLAARGLGFTGRVVLHPRQLDPVRVAFSASATELDRAREVVTAFRRAQDGGVGAIQLIDGTFVDRPVVTRALALLGSEVSR